MGGRAKWLAGAVLGSFACLGCQAPEANQVPWYRGIPSNLTARNSLEAEMWRRQHGRDGDGPPIPSRVVVGPLGSPNETVIPPPMLDEPAGPGEAEGEDAPRAPAKLPAELEPPLQAPSSSEAPSPKKATKAQPVSSRRVR